MGRPKKGEQPKVPATISIDPQVWETYKKNCETVHHDPHWSPHLETLIRAENARLSGADPAAAAAVVDETQLRRRLINITNESNGILDAMSKTARDALDRLTKAYGLDWEDCSNTEDVIRNMLLDYSRQGSAVRNFLKHDGSLTSFNLFTQYIRLHKEKHDANLALINFQLKQANITLEEVAGAAPVRLEGHTKMEKKRKHPEVTKCLECGNWPAEEGERIWNWLRIHHIGPKSVHRCAAGHCFLSPTGNEDACDDAIPKSDVSKKEEPTLEEATPSRQTQTFLPPIDREDQDSDIDLERFGEETKEAELEQDWTSKPSRKDDEDLNFDFWYRYLRGAPSCQEGCLDSKRYLKDRCRDCKLTDETIQAYNEWRSDGTIQAYNWKR